MAARIQELSEMMAIMKVQEQPVIIQRAQHEYPEQINPLFQSAFTLQPNYNPMTSRGPDETHDQQLIQQQINMQQSFAQ